MDNTQHLLQRVADSVAAANAHYEIWFTLRGQGKALPDYHKDMNDHRYVDFFHAINSGTYKLIFIELGCLFDTDDRSASIRNLKSKLEELGRMDLVAIIEHQLEGFGPLVSNILTIRSKLMAHKELGALSTEVHKENGVAPNDIGTLIQRCCAALNEINEQLYGNSGALLCSTGTLRFEKAVFELLNVLRDGRS